MKTYSVEISAMFAAQGPEHARALTTLLQEAVAAQFPWAFVTAQKPTDVMDAELVR